MRARATAEKPCARAGYHRHPTFVCVKDKKARMCKYGRSKMSGKCRTKGQARDKVGKFLVEAVKRRREKKAAMAAAPVRKAKAAAPVVPRRSTRLNKM